MVIGVTGQINAPLGGYINGATTLDGGSVSVGGGVSYGIPGISAVGPVVTYSFPAIDVTDYVWGLLDLS